MLPFTPGPEGGHSPAEASPASTVLPQFGQGGGAHIEAFVDHRPDVGVKHIQHRPAQVVHTHRADLQDFVQGVLVVPCKSVTPLFL